MLNLVNDMLNELLDEGSYKYIAHQFALMYQVLGSVSNDHLNKYRIQVSEVKFQRKGLSRMYIFDNF